MATITPPPAKELGFGDARGCKEWLNALPLTNIPQAQALVLESLRSLNESGLGSLERLKCLELMRDKIAFLQGEQRSRYFGKSLPLGGNDSTAWSTGRALLEEMETGYRGCLAAAQSEGGEIGRLTALISQRIVRYLGAQMLFHALIYKRFDPALWTRLHQQYAAAEAAGIASERIKDSLESDDGASTVAEAYTHAVLLQAAFLAEMTAPQMDFAEALLRLWVRKVPVVTQPNPESKARVDPLVVNLAGNIGARPQPREPLGPEQRLLDTTALSMSIRKRIHGLQGGEDVATLGLPAGSGLDLTAELQRLHKLWCEGAPPRPAGKPATVPTAGLVFSIPEVHFFVSAGKPFEQPDKKRELTRQEKQDIEVFGRVREQTQSKMISTEFNYSVEKWEVVDELLGAVRVQRPATASKGVSIGRLVGIRMGDTGTFFLGTIRELVNETDGRIIATVAIFPGKPEPIAVRAGDLRNRANAQWVPAFKLPALEKLPVAESIVVPSGMGGRGRGIEAWSSGIIKESTVEDVLDRGSDFERVTVF